ncbi:unnamed protein product [Malus baccata var. baccata]
MASPPTGFFIGKIVSFVESKVSLLEGVHDELEDLGLELLTMKAFLADAERKGEALSEVEKTWVANVRYVSLDVEGILDEFTYRINKQTSWGPFKRAFSIPERIGRFGVDHIESVTFTNYDPNTRVKIFGESSLFFKDDDLVGIQYEKEKLIEWLLCKQPHQNLKKHFDCYAWITVSQTYISVEDLLRTMIQELFRATMQAIPLDFSNMSYVHLVEVLVDYLEPKRYFIVLDDVWDINPWGQINVALPNGTHGSIASFSFRVGSRMHHVQPLTDDGAWDLFSMKAFSSWDDSSCPTEFKLIAGDLVRKCQGLPLGIVALGALMSTKRFVPEWTKVYNSLNWELSNNPTLEVKKHSRCMTFYENLLLRFQRQKFCTNSMVQEETNEERRAPRRLTVQINYGELRMKKNMSKVRTFFTLSPDMANTCSTLENLPSGFELLRVLDVKDAPISRLPHEMLPEGIGNLHNLEPLDIRNSKILVLPVGTAKLINLRHLLMYHHQKYDPKSFNLLNGTQVPFDISKLKSLQVLDGMEGGGMLIKQLGHMTELTRLILTNVRDIDEEYLCMSIERAKLLQLLLVKTSNEDEVLRLDALPASPPLLETLALAGKLEKVPLWFPSLQTLQMLDIAERMELKQLPDGIERLTRLQELYFECVPNTLIEGIRTKGSSDHSKVKHVSDIDYLCETDSGWSSERSCIN